MIYRDAFPLCLQCGVALKRFDVVSYSYGRCTQCGGAWVPAGELAEMYVYIGGDVDPHLHALDDKSKRLCLVCRKPMELCRLSAVKPLYEWELAREFAEDQDDYGEKTFAQGAFVIVDRCQDHGIWFDASELQRALHSASGRST